MERGGRGGRCLGVDGDGQCRAAAAGVTCRVAGGGGDLVNAIGYAGRCGEAPVAVAIDNGGADYGVAVIDGDGVAGGAGAAEGGGVVCGAIVGAAVAGVAAGNQIWRGRCGWCGGVDTYGHGGRRAGVACRVGCRDENVVQPVGECPGGYHTPGAVCSDDGGEYFTAGECRASRHGDGDGVTSRTGATNGGRGVASVVVGIADAGVAGGGDIGSWCSWRRSIESKAPCPRRAGVAGDVGDGGAGGPGAINVEGAGRDELADAAGSDVGSGKHAGERECAAIGFGDDAGDGVADGGVGRQRHNQRRTTEAGSFSSIDAVGGFRQCNGWLARALGVEHEGAGAGLAGVACRVRDGGAGGPGAVDVELGGRNGLREATGGDVCLRERMRRYEVDAAIGLGDDGVDDVANLGIQRQGQYDRRTTAAGRFGGADAQRRFGECNGRCRRCGGIDGDVFSVGAAQAKAVGDAGIKCGDAVVQGVDVGAGNLHTEGVGRAINAGQYGGVVSLIIKCEGDGLTRLSSGSAG